MTASANLFRLALLYFLLLPSGPPPLLAQEADQLEIMLDESSDQHMREELGVNPITAPAIRNLLTELDAFRPVPIEIIEKNNREATFSNRRQTAMHFGSLVADGFMLTIAERSSDLENIGRALIRQAANLGVGERLTRRSKSLLEKSGRGDWIGMREELISTQGEVEDAMMELRDEEIAHMVSFGGWLRGFQLAANSTADNYFPTRAAILTKAEIMDYFLERFSTLHPRLQETEFFTRLNAELKTLRDFTAGLNGRAPTQSEVEKMRELGNQLFTLITSRVSEDGRVLP
jgi:hypothetical protein